MSRLDAWRGLAKPFSYCAGQASRIISAKNLLIAMSSLLLIFLVGVTLAAASEATTTLTEKDNGKEIQVKVGTIIELSLEELGSAGYTWEFDQLDEKHFELLKTETRPLSNLPGSPVLGIWQLKAKNAGESQLALDYFRSWEGRAKAVKHFLVKVNIQ
jgi:predicted secreted protein